MRTLALILLLSAPAFADVPPPLWAPQGCIDLGACATCLRRDEACRAQASQQGLELACSARQHEVYCRPGLTRALVSVSGWSLHAAAFAVVAAGLVLVQRRRRAAG